MDINQPPETTSPELKEYLVRSFTDLQVSTEINSLQLAPHSILPRRPTNGEVYYFKKGIPAHSIINNEGFYGKLSTGWSNYEL